MKVLAAILIGAGLLGMAFGTFSYTTEDKVLDVGPLDVTKEETHTQRIPLIASLTAVAIGSVLLFTTRRQHS